MTTLSVPYSRLFLGIIPWYGLLIVIGASCAVFLASREADRCALPAEIIIDLALWVLPLGILGARFYYVLFSWPSFQSNPVSVLFLWEGGLAIYGGLLAGFAVVVLFCRKRNISLLLMSDILIPGVSLAQAIGRWGNYFNQEAYGLPLSQSSAFRFFPAAVQIMEPQGLTWHMATFFYESMLDLLIFLFLIRGRRRLFRKEGDVFVFYLILYGSGRLVIENLRMDSLYMGNSIRVSQLLSLLLSMALCILLLRRRLLEGKGMSRIRWAFVALTSLSGCVALLYSLFPLRFSALSPLWQTGMLLVHAIFLSVTSLLLYGKSNPSEVRYANHQT